MANRSKNPLFSVVALSILILVAVQCSSVQPTPESTATPPTSVANIRFVVITHGQAFDVFWSVVKKGVDQAARDMEVKVQYQAPATFDMMAMAELIDAAVASQPDGLVVSIPDANTLGPSIKAAVDAGIPVISINSGSEAAKSLGVLTHVGQIEYEAGFKGGQRLAAAGVRHAFCINHEVGNRALDLRCEGLVDAMHQAKGKVDILAIDASDPEQAQARILMALETIPSIDGLLTVGPTAAGPASQALQEAGLLNEVKLATFDLSPEILAAIQSGEILFAIDQQQYLQGYLPIVMLKLYHTNANTPASDVIPTGPGFVTQENAAKVIDLSAAGTR